MCPNTSGHSQQIPDTGLQSKFTLVNLAEDPAAVKRSLVGKWSLLGAPSLLESREGHWLDFMLTLIALDPDDN